MHKYQMVKYLTLFCIVNVLILHFTVSYCLAPYSLDVILTLKNFQVNWPPFLPGLVYDSIYQAKTPGLTLYQVAFLSDDQIYRQNQHLK